MYKWREQEAEEENQKKWMDNGNEDLRAQEIKMREAVDTSRIWRSIDLRPHRRRTPDGGEIGLLHTV